MEGDADSPPRSYSVCKQSNNVRHTLYNIACHEMLEDTSYSNGTDNGMVYTFYVQYLRVSNTARVDVSIIGYINVLKLMYFFIKKH